MLAACELITVCVCQCICMSVCAQQGCGVCTDGRSIFPISYFPGLSRECGVVTWYNMLLVLV